MAQKSAEISLQDLTDEGVIIDLDSKLTFDESDYDDEEDISTDRLDEIAIMDPVVEKENEESFVKLKERMTPLLPYKQIHKLLLKEGEGDDLNNYSFVTIHYNAYLDGKKNPFDSSFSRGVPLRFTTCNGEVLPGLDLAVQSMKLHEVSKFLVDPVFAYGKGFGKIPPNSTILFVIQLIEVVNTGGILEFNELSEEEQRKSSNIYKYCEALCEKGKDFFKRKQIKKAIKEFNISLTTLDSNEPNNEELLKNYYNLKMKIFSNLLVCYIKNKEHKKGIAIGEKALNYSKDNDVSGKILYNYGKCLRIEGNYEKAKEMLMKAAELLPKDPLIANELTFLANDSLKDAQNKANWGKALINQK